MIFSIPLEPVCRPKQFAIVCTKDALEPDGRVRVWRRQRERFSTYNIEQVDAYEEGSVTVWAGICLGGRTDSLILNRGALNARRYRDEIQKPIVRSFIDAVGDGFILMQVYARALVDRLSMGFLDEEGIETFEWSARSPDLSPIEHYWDMLSS
ncbi:uncharacterized protein LOC143250028 [Tachypleus tridentatus]|uniref:uncharacterized protein LOC143250028 n=1 Tax=Tachypleus tridentatus TaxID=6853 RepID=UPI003FD5B32C